jgi:hypothetical protein
MKGENIMSLSRNKRTSDEPNYQKRRSFEQGRAEVDAAHTSTHRLHCDAFRFWRRCALKLCKRHRRCMGEPTGCLLRGLPYVPPSLRLRAQKLVIEGGPRRVPPATRIEWTVRRSELQKLVSWGFG